MWNRAATALSHSLAASPQKAAAAVAEAHARNLSLTAVGVRLSLCTAEASLYRQDRNYRSTGWSDLASGVSRAPFRLCVRIKEPNGDLSGYEDAMAVAVSEARISIGDSGANQIILLTPQPN
jgi:hypothetical protein